MKKALVYKGNFAASPICQGTQKSCIQSYFMHHIIPPLLRALRLLVFPTDFVINLAKCLVLAEAEKDLDKKKKVYPWK